MIHHEPSVSGYIVPCSAFVGPGASAAQALFLMRRNGTRFLPVKSHGKIVGLLKEDTVRAASTWGHSRHTKASELMGACPNVVTPDTGLYGVLDETPDSTYGCTVVQNKEGKVEGVFSPLDAVLAFRSLRTAELTA